MRQGRAAVALLACLAVGCGALLTPTQVVSIPMRDGKSLAADVYVPAASAGGATFPTILIQTPYNRLLFRLSGLPLRVDEDVDNSPYAFVILDWRGYYGSAGATVPAAQTDRGNDGFDAIAWIANQTWSNGKVATWGLSALGRIQFETARKHPPALRCIMPMVAGSGTLYSEYFPGGVGRPEYVEQLDALGYGLGAFVFGNPYRNLVWNTVENNSLYPDEIDVPALLIGGWHDHNIDMMMDLFESMRSTSLEVAAKHRMLIGPWSHGTVMTGSAQVGDLSFPAAEGVTDDRMIEWLEWCLLDGDDAAQDHPPYTFFQMGDEQWHSSLSWPPADLVDRTWYLTSDGVLESAKPTSPSAPLSFTYDPTDPSPTVGGATLASDLLQGPYDQSADVESRDDCLVFSTAPLAEAVHVQGSVRIKLNVSSSAVDTDVVVRLTDVHHDGRSMLVTEMPLRLKLRAGLFTQASVSLLTPGTFHTVEVALPHTAVTFAAGHRVRIIVSSSNFPRFHRNSNNGVDPMYPSNNASSLVDPVTTAVNSVAIDGSSFVVLPCSSVADTPTPSGTSTPTPSGTTGTSTPTPSGTTGTSTPTPSGTTGTSTPAPTGTSTTPTDLQPTPTSAAWRPAALPLTFCYALACLFLIVQA